MIARLAARRPLARRPLARRLLALALVLGVLLPASAAAPVAPVTAATPSLTLVGSTTYDVLPDDHRVAVSVQLTATNRLKNTTTRKFLFRTAYLTVLPGTSGFRITGGSGTPKVSVSEKTDAYTILKIDLGANLASGKSTNLTLRFDLQDPGGAPDRATRISPSLVSFGAWAFATPETPGASVAVRLPTGYHVTVGRGPLDGPASDETGHEVWSSGSIENPLGFVADVVADRPAEYVDTTQAVDLEAGPATIVLRAWPDDPAWRDRIGRLVERALPVLEQQIGVAWPVDGALAVNETLVRTTGGYAGVFKPGERRIEIAYAAPDVAVLHELAHAWFNGGLVADRWVAEAFASYYAERAAQNLKLEAPPPVTPADPNAGAIPLNAWGPAGTESAVTESWAYAASLDLARAIAQRAGPSALERVWSMADRGIGAYPPGASLVDYVDAPPDWRGLLDLLEQETGRDFTDLWRARVARPADLELLDDRAATRLAYAHSEEHAGDWALPASIRAAMRAWQFDAANGMLAAADDVLDQRDRLQRSAAQAGATLPGTLQRTFEGNAGVEAAAAEASAEQAVVDAIDVADDARPRKPGILDGLVIDAGLVAADPEGNLEISRSALADGDLSTAYVTARAAESAWANAPRIGRSRIVSSALLLLAVVLLVGLIRQRRRRMTPAPG